MGDAFWYPALLISYFLLGSISILCSAFVIATICKFGATSLSTRLVLYLHICQIIQDLVVLPFIFSQNDYLCQIVGWLHWYSVIAVYVVLVFMSITYRRIFFGDKHKMQSFIKKYLLVIVFGIPLISLVPFSTNSFGYNGIGICGVSTEHYSYMSWVWWMIYLAWYTAAGLISLIIFISTFVKVCFTDMKIGTMLFKSLGPYTFVTLILWIPRAYMNFVVGYRRVGNVWNQHAVVYNNFIVFITGIIYVCIFLREKRSMRLFEQPFESEISKAESQASSINNDHFSWDEDTDADIILADSYNSKALRHAQDILNNEYGDRISTDL